MSSGSIRIIQLPEKSSVNTDDYMAVDSSANGTKKVKFTDLLDDNLSAQNKAADAQATGEAINNINARVDNMINTQQNASVTTLWTGSISLKNQTATLSESIANFDFVDIYIGSEDTVFARKPVSSSVVFQIQTQNMSDDASSQFLRWYETGLTISGTTATINKTIRCYWDDFSTQPVVAQATGSNINIIRIDGVKIGHVENDEIVDARVGANGVTYSTLGDAIRSQVTDLKNDIDTIAKKQTIETGYQLELINPRADTILKTNNITGKTNLMICVSSGNIIRLPYFRPSGYTQNELTFTINSDGSITVNGTASADTTYNIVYYNTNVVQFSKFDTTLDRQVYGWVLSGCSDGSDSTYYLMDVVSGVRCKTAPVNAWSTGPRSAMNLALVVKSGVTLNNKTFYPMASYSGEESFTPPIAQADQYTATVASTDEVYEWQNVNFKNGYNLIVGNDGDNTLTAIVSSYDTFAEIHEEIDEIAQEVGVNWWQGKKWVAFGTSITDNYSQNAVITQGEYAGEPTGKYVPYLLDMSKLDSTSFVNRGIAGGSINGHILYYIRYYTSDEANADIITIEGAVNDFATDVPLGEVGDTVPYTNTLLPDSSSDGTFAGACYQAFTTAITNAPNAVIVLLTETTGKNHVGYANYNQLRKNNLGLYQSDYIEMTMKVAEFVGIPVINCGRDSMINAQNPQYIADHIHHTYLGGYQYARTIWSKLKVIPLKALNLPT